MRVKHLIGLACEIQWGLIEIIMGSSKFGDVIGQFSPPRRIKIAPRLFLPDMCKFSAFIG